MRERAIVKILTDQQLMSAVRRYTHYDVTSTKPRRSMHAKLGIMLYAELQRLVNNQNYHITKKSLPRMFVPKQFLYLLTEPETLLLYRFILKDIQKQLIIKFLLYMKRYKALLNASVITQIQKLNDPENYDEYIDREKEFGQSGMTTTEDKKILQTILNMEI
ncbi:MAG TPA: hypothetical protein P5545_07805 [Bacteroidota bacterium]|nr:hypothetical protein [Candidatus Kapabacteria bacterium]HRS02437.1 hypothetical protein [Bacteroidota bacterium]